MQPREEVPRGSQGEIPGAPPPIGGVVIGPEVPEPVDLSKTPFGGSRTGAGGASNRIDINFDPRSTSDACPCERIRFIQVMQILVDGIPVDPGDLWNDWEYRDNTALDDDPDTPEDETGVHVDRVPGRTQPYYGGNGAGTGSSTVGQCNGTSTPGTMVDLPFMPDGYFQPGGPDAALGGDWDADEIVFKFETCAFCEAGEQVGRYFECVNWTYTRTKADVASGSPGRAAIEGTETGPSKAFTKAAQRWAETNNFDLPEAS